ncbi:unnamed protein product [Alopecurus aequalis]
MRNPCECCQSKLRFIRQINGNFMHSMVIPDRVVKYFGGKLPGTVKLEAANGNIYDVGVTESMNRKLLQSGWATFVDANKLEENYSLMFRYLGNARFQVTIFDSSGKEKALCCAGMKAASDVQPPNSRYVDNSSSSHDGTAQSPAREGSDSDGCPKESSCPKEFSEDDPSAGEPMELNNPQMLTKDCVLSGRCILTVAQKAKIHALIAEIQPKIPVLVVLIKKTNVEPCTIVVIRKDYAYRCLPRGSQTITLQVPGKRNEWHCSLYIQHDGGCKLRLANFVRDNRVREGDVCIFQPMSKVKAGMFKVMVHVLHKESIGHSSRGRTGTVANHSRTSTKIASKVRVEEEKEPATDGEEISSYGYEDHGSSDNSEGASDPPFMLPDRTFLGQAQEKKVLEKVSVIDSELPIYVAIMNKTSVRRNCPYLFIGKRYVSMYLINRYTTRHHGKNSVISLVLQQEGKSRTWDTELRCTSDSGTMISKGWGSFAHANCLREDDICLFKLMENEEPLKMMVYIIRQKKC